MLAAARAAWPARLTGKSDDYVDAHLQILCEMGADASAAIASAPAPFVVDADGSVAVLEHAPVRQAWRTGAALTGAVTSHVRGQA